MIIELKGGQAQNLGAKLMLIAVRDRLRARFPGAAIALRQTPLLNSDFRRAFGAVRKFPLRKRQFDLTRLAYVLPSNIWSTVLGGETVVESQIDAVLDLSGFAYGDRWGSGSTGAAGAEIERLSLRGKAYIFLPQAFGPFDGLSASLATTVGRQWAGSALICARDTQSCRSLEMLLPGEPNNVVVCPDLTFAVEGKPALASTNASSRDTALIVPNVRMTESVSRGPLAVGYVPMMLRLASAARRHGFDVKVLNHGGHEDSPLCQRIAIALGAEILTTEDPLDIKAIIGAAGLVISSRFHACVAALSQGVPCIATAWNHKYRELFAPFGLEYAVLEDGGESDYVPLVARVLDDHQARTTEFAAVRAAMMQNVEQMWSRVYAILDRVADDAGRGRSR